MFSSFGLDQLIAEPGFDARFYTGNGEPPPVISVAPVFVISRRFCGSTNFLFRKLARLAVIGQLRASGH